MPDRESAGLLFIGDPHLASRVPGFRKDDYPRTVLSKLEWCLEYARRERLVPALLGDLFNYPRDNANWLLVRLLELLREPALAITGNHDCQRDQLEDDDSLMLLAKAGRVHLLDRDGPWRGRINGRAVVVGGTTYRRPLPERYEGPDGQDETPLVFWLLHHDVRLPGYEESGYFDPREVPGIDVMINGHIHRPLPEMQAGRTLWLNPGNIARVKRTDAERDRRPSVLRIDVGARDWTKTVVEVPHQAFEDVFHEEIAAEPAESADSLFIKGLAELQARRTESGAGLLGFIQENLGRFSEPVANEILRLAKEACHDEPA